MTLFNAITLFPIVYELLQNLALLYTLISLFMPMVTKGTLEYSAKKIHSKGVIFFSVLALVSMFMPIRFIQIPDVIIDLRIAIITLASVYLGPLNSFLVGTMTIAYRSILGGLGWISWLPVALLCGPLSYYIVKRVRNRTIGLIMASVVCTLTSTVVFALIAQHFNAFVYFSPFANLDNYLKITFALVVCNSLAAIAYDHAIKSIISRQQNYQALRIKADTDGMTGLYNHNRFQQELSQSLERARINKSHLSLLLVDLDYFKEYNDNLGHQAGDVLLKEVAKIFLDGIRPNDIAARYGGEEFAIILPDCSAYEALKIAERIRVKVEQNSFYGREKMPKRKVTVSIGIACFSGDVTDKDVLIRKADTALYSVKRTGRNKSLVFSPYKNVCLMVK